MRNGRNAKTRLSRDTRPPDLPSKHPLNSAPLIDSKADWISSAPERPSFAFQVDKAVREHPTPAAELEASASYREDSDSWLEVSPEEVDAMLAARSGAAEPGGGADVNGETQQGDERGQALSDLAKKVEDFVGGKGDMEGARFAE